MSVESDVKVLAIMRDKKKHFDTISTAVYEALLAGCTARDVSEACMVGVTSYQRNSEGVS